MHRIIYGASRAGLIMAESEEYSLAEAL